MEAGNITKYQFSFFFIYFCNSTIIALLNWFESRICGIDSCDLQPEHMSTNTWLGFLSIILKIGPKSVKFPQCLLNGASMKEACIHISPSDEMSKQAGILIAISFWDSLAGLGRLGHASNWKKIYEGILATTQAYVIEETYENLKIALLILFVYCLFLLIVSKSDQCLDF